MSAGNSKLARRLKSREAGFTLVEMMTVLVIIGLISSAVILTLPKDKPEIITFADAFHGEVNRAAQMSLLSGKVTALGLSEESYSILTYENETWTTTTQGHWPDGAFVRFEKDKAPIKLSENIIPLALFEPTGHSTIFTLQLADVNSGYRFTSSGDGRVYQESLK